MADRWLNRLACLNNIVPNNRNRRKPYLFDYGKYDEEQFRNRYRLTNAAFCELLEIIRPDISAHNGRGKPIPADIQLLLTLRFYATGTFQLACGDLCEISQPSASWIIKRVSEAIARLKNIHITFPDGDMLQQLKLDFWRICAFPSVVGAIDCTHIKIQCPGARMLNSFVIGKGIFQ